MCERLVLLLRLKELGAYRMWPPWADPQGDEWSGYALLAEMATRIDQGNCIVS